jgi:hypothetical protein
MIEVLKKSSSAKLPLRRKIKNHWCLHLASITDFTRKIFIWFHIKHLAPARSVDLIQSQNTHEHILQSVAKSDGDPLIKRIC